VNSRRTRPLRQNQTQNRVAVAAVVAVVLMLRFHGVVNTRMIQIFLVLHPRITIANTMMGNPMLFLIMVRRPVILFAPFCSLLSLLLAYISQRVKPDVSLTSFSTLRLSASRRLVRFFVCLYQFVLEPSRHLYD